MRRWGHAILRSEWWAVYLSSPNLHIDGATLPGFTQWVLLNVLWSNVKQPKSHRGWSLAPLFIGSFGPWLCGLLGVWLHGSLGLCIFGSMGTWLCGSLGPWLCGPLGPWLCGSLGRPDPSSRCGVSLQGENPSVHSPLIQWSALRGKNPTPTYFTACPHQNKLLYKWISWEFGRQSW